MLLRPLWARTLCFTRRLHLVFDVLTGQRAHRWKHVTQCSHPLGVQQLLRAGTTQDGVTLTLQVMFTTIGVALP